MLKKGLYYARHEDSPDHPNPCNDYYIVVRVRETQRAIFLQLVEMNARYGATQIKDLFREKDSCCIHKDGSKHALSVWDDSSFTLYPYRVGVPYYFRFGG